MGSDKPDYTLGISILEQALANLTAVVTATALDIRALNELDVPNEALPYEDSGISGSQANIAQNAEGEIELTEANWGAGKDFYVSMIMIQVRASALFLAEYDQFLQITLDNDASPTERFFNHTYSGQYYTPGYTGANWVLARTYHYPRLRKVASGEKLIALLLNESGPTVNFDLWLAGIPK